MHSRRKYTLKETQMECCGSTEEEAVSTKLGAVIGSIEEVVFELGLVDWFYFNRQERTWKGMSDSMTSMNKGIEVSGVIKSS